MRSVDDGTCGKWLGETRRIGLPRIAGGFAAACRSAGRGSDMGLAVARSRAVARDDVGLPLQSRGRLAAREWTRPSRRLPRAAGHPELHPYPIGLLAVR